MRIHLSTTTLGGVALTLALGFTPIALGQTLPPPKLNTIFPMGGKAGTTLELKITGQELEKVEGLYFSIPGVKVEMDSGEATASKPDMAKKGMTKPPPAQLTHKFKVTFPANAPLGSHDVRVITKGGISNPRAFIVGDQKELAENEPNDDTPKAQRIELNSIVNGVISAPTDVDYFQFTGKKGQRVLCSCLASSIDSKLPAAVELYSAAGTYFGMNRNYHGNDALLDVTLPEDGDFLVRLFSFTYTQGGVDFFYRLNVTTSPWIDGVHPPTVEPGKASEVMIVGRNLPGGKADPASVLDGRVLETLKLTVKAPDDKAVRRLDYSGLVLPHAAALDGFEHRVTNDSGSSNPALLLFARAPVVLDNEKNDSRETAQDVPVPSEIAGRVDKKGDLDWYSFSAKKGQVLALEALGERLGSPIDLYFVLQNDKGNVLVEQDDVTDNLSLTFLTRTDDPGRYRFTVAADGRYFIKISSRAAFTDAGPRHGYVLRIAQEDPDFQVFAMPASQLAPDAGLLGQSGNFAYTVYVWRQSGFDGDVKLSGESLPPGVSIKPQLVSSGQKQAVLVVSAAPDAPPFAGAIKVVGTATVKGMKLVREVRGATITWPVPQPNTPTITRLDRELVLAVRDKAPYALTAEKDSLQVVQGDKISVAVKLKALAGDFKTPVQLVALGLPTNLTMPPITLTAEKATGTAFFESKGNQAISPGNYTLVLRGQTQPILLKPQPMKGPAPPNFVQYTQPVSLTIIPKQLAKLTLNPQQPKVKIGKEVDLNVKLARESELLIAFKVEAIVPSNVKGISAAAVMIGEKDVDAKLVLKASTESMANANVPIVIRATAMFNGTVPVVHETKLTVNVTK